MALLAALGTTSALADVQLEPQPCVITLAPAYPANVDGTIYQRPIPDSAIACPGFAFNAQTMTVNAWFQDAAGDRGPQLANNYTTTFDAARNAVVTTYGLELVGYRGNSPTGIFTTVAPDYNSGGFWLVNPADNKNYRLVLGTPFRVTSATAATPSCRLNLSARYAYKWDQENYFVVPDSAVRCEGFTFSSQAADLSMTFSSKVIGAGNIGTYTRRVFNPSTGTYSTIWELRLTSYAGNVQSQAERHRQNGIPATTGGGAWTWGRFKQDVNGAVVRPYVNPNPLQQEPQYRLVLGKSFAIKRATTVTASGTRLAGGQLKVKIHADRNLSFQNTTAPTYRRQTVVPGTPADHARLRRNGRLIRTVRLSPYGNATVTIPATGRHRYTVQMVETDDNFAGSASFRR